MVNSKYDFYILNEQNLKIRISRVHDIWPNDSEHFSGNSLLCSFAPRSWETFTSYLRSKIFQIPISQYRFHENSNGIEWNPVSCQNCCFEVDKRVLFHYRPFSLFGFFFIIAFSRDSVYWPLKKETSQGFTWRFSNRFFSRDSAKLTNSCLPLGIFEKPNNSLPWRRLFICGRNKVSICSQNRWKFFYGEF